MKPIPIIFGLTLGFVFSAWIGSKFNNYSNIVPTQTLIQTVEPDKEKTYTTIQITCDLLCKSQRPTYGRGLLTNLYISCACDKEI